MTLKSLSLQQIESMKPFLHPQKARSLDNFVVRNRNPSSRKTSIEPWHFKAAKLMDSETCASRSHDMRHTKMFLLFMPL